jgi:prepilin signal peptidase PulO-like enzyme (type II secretory pathway)
MIFFMGASIGSFSLVIVRRGHNDDWKSWLTGKSYCESCKKTLTALELIPFFSFICLGGKCSKCKSKIDPSHFICETFAGIMYVALFAMYNFGIFDLPKFIFMLVANSFMIALSASDFLYREINVIPVYILAVVGFVYNAVYNQSYWSIAISIILFVGLGILFAKDNFAAFGSGDIDVVIAIYALLGSVFGIIDVIMYASLAGIILFVTLYRKTEKTIPFVPCLYFGYFVSAMGVSVSRMLFDWCQTLFKM